MSEHQRYTKRPIRKIGCFGEVLIELSHQNFEAAQIGVAGDTYNTAVYLRHLLDPKDADVAYVTAIGSSDAFSLHILEQLRGHGLSDAFVERCEDKNPGLYAIENDPSGERSFSYWRSNSAARTLFSEPCLVSLSKLNEMDLVYFSGISLAILQPATRRDVLSWAREFSFNSGTIAFDSNYRPRLWENQTTAQEACDQAWRIADIALPSLDDELALFGEANSTDVLARFDGYGIMQGVIKRGSEGPLDLRTKGTIPNLKSSDQVIDTTGAGDSFNAGYLAAYTKSLPGEAPLQIAHDLALQVIGHNGAILPEQRLDQLSNRLT